MGIKNIQITTTQGIEGIKIKQYIGVISARVVTELIFFLIGLQV
jgi:uncharacterized protein YbjQ (UPF0145 family)